MYMWEKFEMPKEPLNSYYTSMEINKADLELACRKSMYNFEPSSSETEEQIKQWVDYIKSYIKDVYNLDSSAEIEGNNVYLETYVPIKLIIPLQNTDIK